MSTIGTNITAILSWIGNLVDTITSDSSGLMLLPVAVFALGVVISFAQRLLNN